MRRRSNALGPRKNLHKPVRPTFDSRNWHGTYKTPPRSSGSLSHVKRVDRVRRPPSHVHRKTLERDGQCAPSLNNSLEGRAIGNERLAPEAKWPGALARVPKVCRRDTSVDP